MSLVRRCLKAKVMVSKDGFVRWNEINYDVKCSSSMYSKPSVF